MGEGRQAGRGRAGRRGGRGPALCAGECPLALPSFPCPPPLCSTGELPAEVCALLKALRSVSEAAFQPSAAPGQATTAPHERHQSAARVAFAAACDAGLPPPEDWRSAEEAFLRCACWGGPPQRDGWQPTPYGGSHILYALPEYAADHSNRSDKRTTCTKHQHGASFSHLCSFMKCKPRSEVTLHKGCSLTIC